MKVEPSLNLVSKLVRGICRYPDKCEIEIDRSGNFPSLSVTPHGPDYPLLNGKGGRQTKAMFALCQELGIHYRLVDGDYGEKENHRFEQNPEFDVDACLEFVSEVVNLLDPAAAFVQHERSNDELHVYVPDLPQHLVRALDDLFYPWAWQRGMILKIRQAKSVNVES